VFCKLWKALRATVLTRDAINFGASGDYNRSIKTLDQVGIIYNAPFPSEDFPPHINILYASLGWRVDKILAYGAIEVASGQLF
jgi:hypothetical protein